MKPKTKIKKPYHTKTTTKNTLSSSRTNKTEWTILQRKKDMKGYVHGIRMLTAIYETTKGKRTDFPRARVTTEKQWRCEMWSIWSEVKLTAVR